MATQYQNVLECLRLLGLGRGLLEGSIKPGDMDEESVLAELKSLAAVHNIIEWALMACISLMWQEHAIKCVRLPKLTGLYNFPWSVYNNRAAMIDKILDAGERVEPRVHPEVARAIFYSRPYNMRGSPPMLDNKERATVYRAALGKSWSPAFTRKVAWSLMLAKTTTPLTQEFMDTILQAANRRIEVERSLSETEPEIEQSTNPSA